MRIFLAMIVGDMTRFLLWLFDGGFNLLAVDFYVTLCALCMQKLGT